MSPSEKRPELREIPGGKSAGPGRCTAKVEVYSRVVGYYRPLQHWNPGKQSEFKNRRTFRLDLATYRAKEKKP